MTDNELITACIAADRRAQRQLFDRFAPRLKSVALRYMHQEQSAEDVLAEAWIKIFRGLASFSGEGSFEGWLRRIVANEALMQLRKGRLDIAELSDAVTDTTPTPVRIVDGLEQEDVLRLLGVLPEGCRIVFNLYELEGLKHREIAEELGVSINTSKSQLILAKRKLREAYQVLSRREGATLRPLPKTFFTDDSRPEISAP